MTKIYNIVKSIAKLSLFFNFSWKTRYEEWFTLTFAAFAMILSPLDKALQDDIPENSVILYGILDWGMGHTTRSLPIIKALQQAGHEVFIAAESNALSWIKNELPDGKFIEIPKSGFKHIGRYLALNIAFNVWPMFRQVVLDKLRIKRYIKETKATIVISDNRFVFKSRLVRKNIYITHQTTIHHPAPFLSKCLTRGHRWFIRRFTTCWIYDDETSRLAGILSDPGDLPSYKFIGNHSRMLLPAQVKKSTDILFLLSGPEPQRSIFEKQIFRWAQNQPQYRICLIRGTNKPLQWAEKPATLDIINLANTQSLQEKIGQTRSLISRPGYTTLMDVAALSIPILWVATPGQTEQEYLADLLGKKQGLYRSAAQSKWEEVLLEFLATYAISHLDNP